MQVRIAALADFASISEGNKLNILGIFTNIHALQTPLSHPQMKLVAQLEFESSEVGDKNLAVILVDDDGQEIQSIRGGMVVEREVDGRPTLISLIMDFQGLIFPKLGGYEFRILIDDEEQCAIPLNVIQVPQ